jgi:hypothetical protein
MASLLRRYASSMSTDPRRARNTLLCLAALMALMGACSPKAAQDYRRIAARERDPVPPLYQGPIMVEGMSGGTPQVTSSDGGKRRIDQTYSSGTSHSIALPGDGVIYHWLDFGRDKGVLRTSKMARGTRAVLRRWNGRERAQRLGPCSSAGERGSTYRFTVGPNLKGPGGNFIEACITPDGVVLTEAVGSAPLGAGVDPTKAAATIFFHASSVHRGPLAADTFKVPAGLSGPSE